MKASLPQNINRRFPLLFSAAAVFVAAVAFWFIWQIFVNDTDLNSVHHYSVLIAAILSTLIVFLAASLIRIRVLLRSYKDLLQNNIERQQTEDILRESEERYRMVTESASDAILTIDQAQTIIFANAAAEKIFGYKVDEMLGNRLFKLIPGHVHAGISERTRRRSESGKQDDPWQGIELSGLHKDGSEVPIEVTFGEIKSGGQSLFTAVIRDVTERKRAKEDLQKNLSLLSSTFEATAEGLLVVDRKNKIVTYNQHFVDMAMIPDEVMKLQDNYKVIDFVSHQLVDPEAFIEKAKQLVRRPETSGHGILEFKDGRIFERYSHPQILDGEVIGRVLSFRDITERKRAEITSQVISEIIQGVTTTSNLEELLALIQQSVGRSMYAENFYVALYDRHTELFHIPFWVDKHDSAAPSHRLGKGLTSYVYRTGRPALLTTGDVVRLRDQGEVELIGTSSAVWLGIPLRTPTEIIGVLAVQHYEDKNAFTDRDIELLSTAGAQIALAIQRKRAEEALCQSEEKYRTILETTGEAYYEMDLAGNFTFFNDILSSFLGYGNDELRGLNYLRYVDPSAAEKVFRAFNKVFTTGQSLHRIEYEVIRKDGSRIFNETSASLIRNEAEEPVGFRGVVRDVTERKNAEEVLRQSEEKYRNILETIEEGYFETDLEGAFTFYNEALGDVLGYNADELLGMHYRQYADHRNAKKLFISYVKVLRTGQPLKDLNWEVKCKNGTRRFIESSITLIRSSEGTVVGFRGLARDVTQRKRTEEALRESESILAAAQRITHLGSWELDLVDLEDPRKNEVRWSKETYRIFGFEQDEVEASSELFYNLVHSDDREYIRRVLTETIEQRKPYSVEHRVILRDKTERYLHGQAELICDKHSGRPLKLVGTVQDITERRRTDAALRESEFKLRTLFTSMNEGLTQVDNNEVIEFVNDRLCEITGFTREEMIGKKTLDLFFDDEGRSLVIKVNKERQKGISGQYEARIRTKSGELLWVLVSGAPIISEDGKTTGTLGMFMDISERKRVESQLLHDAFHDGLTGLANRALFMDHLRQTIERCKSRHSNYYAILFLDFDRFKVINDSLGHAEGDELLKQITRRLEAVTRTGDLLARLGGDEFVLLLTEMLDINDAIQVAERIQSDLIEPFNLSGNEVFISASIGIALSTDGHKRAEDMLRDADIAMYRAKAKGKARYQVFNQAIRTQATTRLQIETEIRSALERGEFELHYQPIMNLETQGLSGFESLVRWRHPKRGMISPDDFIPAAEENGLILPLGNWILEESCRQMLEWQNVYPRASELVVSVNLSSKQFLQTNLAAQVARTLKTTGLSARSLKLEITESYLMDNSEKAVKIMNRLRSLGVEMSLDDFGTGYSSLSYLHRLPVNSLKIDRSFISRMTESEENYEIVRTIVKLAKNLKMYVVAEGVETAEQLAQLTRLHCSQGQGYFFSKPLEAERAAAFIDANIENLTGTDEQPVIRLELNM